MVEELFHIIKGDVEADFKDICAALGKKLLSIIVRGGVAGIKFVKNDLIGEGGGASKGEEFLDFSGSEGLSGGLTQLALVSGKNLLFHNEGISDVCPFSGSLWVVGFGIGVFYIG